MVRWTPECWGWMASAFALLDGILAALKGGWFLTILFVATGFLIAEMTYKYRKYWAVSNG